MYYPKLIRYKSPKVTLCLWTFSLFLPFPFLMKYLLWGPQWSFSKLTVRSVPTIYIHRGVSRVNNQFYTRGSLNRSYHLTCCENLQGFGLRIQKKGLNPMMKVESSFFLSYSLLLLLDIFFNFMHKSFTDSLIDPLSFKVNSREIIVICFWTEVKCRKFFFI